jgi:hypothetical protein
MSKRQEQRLSASVIGQLQEALLKAVLLREPLPGVSQPLAFADLAFVLNQPEILVSNEHVAGPIAINDAPRSVRVLSPSDIAKLVRHATGDVVFLRFQQPEVANDTVGLTLEAKLVPRDGGQQPLGLSGVQVRFRKIGGRWQADEPPAHFAV